MTTQEIQKEPLPGQLALLINEQHLSAPLVQQITGTFAPLFVQAQTVLDEASSIDVKDASDLRQMKAAGDLRKTLKTIRGTAEKARVSMTAEALKVKSTIDLVARTLRVELEAAEEWLEGHEKYAEKLQAAREAALKADRGAKLTAVGCDPAMYQLGTMTDRDFQMLLNAATGEHKLRLAEEQDQRDRAAAAEQARQLALEEAKAENERLRQQQAEQDRLALEERRRNQAELSRLEAERNAADLKAKREREAFEARAKKEREESERRAQEARDMLKANEDAAEDKRRREREAEAEKARASEQRAANERLAAKKLADEAAAKAKKASDAKLAEEARKRKAVEAMAGEMLAFIKDAIPLLAVESAAVANRGLALIAKAEGGAA